ncbi:hypothetical protein [Candidatus Poriferisodalis sp.]|uniref:hypothetical protein n=1 Tax=Candidatus Poriferisodalis sp. TaxID=3101277 RepID=UPI003AF46DBE
MSDRDALRRKIESLSPMGVRFVARMVESLSEPPQAQRSAVGQTWITAEPDWIEYFGLLISAHHGLAVDALKETGFENAFRDACEAVGWSVDPPASATQRFVDLTVETPEGRSRRLSLKSTAAQRLSQSTIHISKLTEAAWIQDVRSAKSRRAETLTLFEQYCDAVDAIVMLRAFRDDPQSIPYRYQLVEIPSAIFASLQSLGQPAFEADGPTLDCSFQGDAAAARVSLDRSDAKVTVKQIKLSACVVHEEWELGERGS